MRTVYPLLPFILGVLTLLVGVFASYKFLGYLFSFGEFNPENASKLIRLQKPEEWNTVRDLNPEWLPVLKRSEFRELNLPSINFQRAVLDGSKFTGTILDKADFRKASLKEVDFSGASLKGAIFDYADLEKANFAEAILDNASITNTKSTPEKISSLQTPPTTEHLKDIIDLIRNNPESLSEISPRAFEELVAQFLKERGIEVNLTASGTKDTGIDIIASHPEEFGESLHVVECKAYSPDQLVGISPVQALYSAKLSQGADRAILVTNSRFTEQAKLFASSHRDVTLVDRDMLISWITGTPILT